MGELPREQEHALIPWGVHLTVLQDKEGIVTCAVFHVKAQSRAALTLCD